METWEYDDAQFCVSCPQCGGILIWGTLYDWPVHLGGDPCGDYVRCKSCKTVWENIWHADYEGDEEPKWPEGCFDENMMVVGWALNGGFTNGCEGPVHASGFRQCDHGMG